MKNLFTIIFLLVSVTLFCQTYDYSNIPKCDYDGPIATDTKFMYKQEDIGSGPKEYYSYLRYITCKSNNQKRYYYWHKTKKAYYSEHKRISDSKGYTERYLCNCETDF